MSLSISWKHYENDQIYKSYKKCCPILAMMYTEYDEQGEQGEQDNHQEPVKTTDIHRQLYVNLFFLLISY